MHELILWAGFAGAWLLVAGPIQQAVIELSDEALERDRYAQAMTAMPPPPSPSPWWWLVPPIRLWLGHRHRDQWQRDFLTALPDEDYEQLASFLAKARTWILVGTGGFLIAAKETYELVEGMEWPLWLFWLLGVVLLAASVGAAALRAARTAREAEARKARRRDDPDRAASDNGAVEPP